jgi:hypothetical protein
MKAPNSICSLLGMIHHTSSYLKAYISSKGNFSGAISMCKYCLWRSRQLLLLETLLTHHAASLRESACNSIGVRQPVHTGDFRAFRFVSI